MKAILFAALLVLAAGVQVQREVDEECASGGPIYWCKNIVTATQCQAIDYCKERVWVTKLTSENDVCTECKQYVGTIHLLIASNSTQAEILAALKSMCSVMPQSLQEVCSELVDLYGPQLVQQLVDYTADPSQLCTTLGLCNSGTVVLSKQAKLAGRLVRIMQQVKPAGGLCSLCEQYAGAIGTFLASNETQAEILGVFKEVCSVLPSSLGDMCNSFVDAYVPKVLSVLVDFFADPSQLCTMMGLCPGRSGFESLLPAFRRPDLHKSRKPLTDYCTMCKQYVGTIHMLLANNETQAEILGAVKQVCSLLPSSVSGMCNELVDTYGQQAISMIVDYLADPSQLCSLMGLCPGKIGLLMPRLPFVGSGPFVVTREDVRKVGDDALCSYCMIAVATLDEQLLDNKTRDEYIAAVQAMCTYLPPDYTLLCQAVVGQYAAKAIAEYLERFPTPQSFCEYIYWCTPSSLSKEKSSNLNIWTGFVSKDKSNRNLKRAGTVTCEVCTYAMGYLDKVLEDKATQAEIEAAVRSVCGFLPSALQSECNELIEEYFQAIVDLLVKEMDPAVICKELGLCATLTKPKSPVSEARKLVKPKDPVTCQLCQYAMGYLDGMLKDNATVAEIEAAVESLCSYLPSSVRDECKSLVDTYGQSIIDLLAEELKPEVVCKVIGLCSGKSVRPVSKKANDVVTCEVCQYAMGYLYGILKDKTAPEVRSALDTLCSKLPSVIAGECTTLVNTYSDEIVKLVISELSPDLICKHLGLCPSNAKKFRGSRPRSTFKLGFMRPAAISCSVCQYAMGYLDSTLQDKATQGAIEKAIESVCAVLPDAFKNECDQLVSQYGGDLIDLLVQKELQPNQVCSALKLC